LIGLIRRRAGLAVRERKHNSRLMRAVYEGVL
jgi:hypothetical protein